MWYFNHWSMEAFIYLGLHGTYCALWLMKSALFPDRRLEETEPLRVGLPLHYAVQWSYRNGSD